jgi:spore coat polysaccharide biosynthesis protein SpsF
MGSTRLPNKMILDYFNNRGIFENLLIRLNNANLNVPIIVATTRNIGDNTLEEIANSHNITCFRGSDNNVLKRFIDVADKFHFSKIIRICADNPFLDINEISNLIENFKKTNFDYYGYTLDGITPTIKTGFGFWAEGVRTETLRAVYKATNDNFYLEHVTNYIYEHSNKYKVHFEKLHQFSHSLIEMRLTVDTVNDFLISKEIYSKCMQQDIPINPKNIEDIVKNNLNWIKTMNQETQNNLK